jgi:hypothetical protein
MGWIAIYKNGKIEKEGDEGVGRPVQAGENGELLAVAQEDFGRTVLVDLTKGTIAIDFESPVTIQNNTIELRNPKLTFMICEETNIVGELFHVKHEFLPWYNCMQTKIVDGQEVACDDGHTDYKIKCENGHMRRPVLQPDGSPVMVRNDHISPIIWRPIWFTRYTNGMPTKIIGAQTTTPEIEGARNIKKLIMIYADGKIGID